MDGETILGAVVLIFCGFGCGSLFSWIGSWAERRKDPMHFWTGSAVDPKTITDVPAYNKANGKMWKRYAVPYWLTGWCGFACFLNLSFAAQFGCILIGLASTVGIVWLVCAYKRIEKRYKIQNP